MISWLKLPEDVRPHLIMWYMEEPDAIGHSATPDSSATLDVVENLDKVLNHFFTEARQLDIFDKIDFIVLSYIIVSQENLCGYCLCDFTESAEYNRMEEKRDS